MGLNASSEGQSRKRNRDGEEGSAPKKPRLSVASFIPSFGMEEKVKYLESELKHYRDLHQPAYDRADRETWEKGIALSKLKEATTAKDSAEARCAVANYNYNQMCRQTQTLRVENKQLKGALLVKTDECKRRTEETQKLKEVNRCLRIKLEELEDRRSKGEKLTDKVLRRTDGVTDIADEFTIKDDRLRPKGRYKRYDFRFLYNGHFYLTEYAGEQHFKKVGHFRSNPRDGVDLLKTKVALEYGYRMIHISCENAVTDDEKEALIEYHIVEALRSDKDLYVSHPDLYAQIGIIA